ncbi:MAG: peptidylprolyl isomerase [Pseudomonadota bacterium]
MLVPATPLFTRIATLTVAVSLVFAAPNIALAQDADAPAPAAEAPPAPLDPDAVIGQVAGQDITNRDIDFALADLQEQLGQVPQGQRRVAALMALVDIRLLAAKAEAEGVGEDAVFQRRMQFQRNRALHNNLFTTEVVGSVTDEEVRARYDSEISARPPENEVRARHILVETEDAAKDVITELDGGADFATLAAERSTGPSGPNGGDLGYFTRGRMVPEFEAAAFELNAGDYSKEPVQTQFGWHVILVEDSRPVQPPAFEQVAPQIRSGLLRERYFELLQSLRGETDVEIIDPALAEAYDAATASRDPSLQQQ